MKKYRKQRLCNVSIPFEQGDVFRPNTVTDLRNEMQVSIPFEQGDVFRRAGGHAIDGNVSSQSLSSRAMSFDEVEFIIYAVNHMSQSLSSRAMSFDRFERSRYFNANRLNPFRAGRCLSTRFSPLNKKSYCLNPFRAGRCLSTIEQYRTLHKIRSQSLSSRAMSFDNGREWNYF